MFDLVRIPGEVLRFRSLHLCDTRLPVEIVLICRDCGYCKILSESMERIEHDTKVTYYYAICIQFIVCIKKEPLEK